MRSCEPAGVAGREEGGAGAAKTTVLGFLEGGGLEVGEIVAGARFVGRAGRGVGGTRGCLGRWERWAALKGCGRRERRERRVGSEGKVDCEREEKGGKVRK